MGNSGEHIVPFFLDIKSNTPLEGSYELQGYLNGSPQVKDDLRKKIERLSRELNAEQTEQRNAWYFGAIKALEGAGYNAMDFIKELELTVLQAENAKRFLKRIQKFYPNRDELSFEPRSLVHKINLILEKGNFPPTADFIMLTSEECVELHSKMRRLIKRYKANGKSQAANDLHMIYFGSTNLIGKG